MSVRYTGTLDDGSVFDSNMDASSNPLTFVVGSGQIIPGFDTAVRGMMVGQEKTVTIPPDQAYGQPTPVPPETYPLSALPDGTKVGDQLAPGVKVIAIQGDYAWLTNDNPLAGKTLHFDIKVVDIK